MANEIKLITFADSEVTATDDAYVYESAIGEGGIINGCEVTIKNASELHINGGNGVLCGRKFTVYDSDLPVTLSSSGTLLGRLYIHMDLSNASTPIQLMIETGGSLTPVQQDADVNATNGVYEINLSTFNVDTSTISDLVDVSPKVYTHEVLNTIEECVASTNPGDIAGASVAAMLNSKLLKLLWTNPSPTSNMGETQITLSSGDYDVLKVIYKLTATANYYEVAEIFKGLSHIHVCVLGNATYSAYARQISFTSDDTKLNVANGYSSGSQASSVLIPYKIYGYKLQ
jgi:hypothetical protein